MTKRGREIILTVTAALYLTKRMKEETINSLLVVLRETYKAKVFMHIYHSL